MRLLAGLGAGLAIPVVVAGLRLLTGVARARWVGFPSNLRPRLRDGVALLLVVVLEEAVFRWGLLGGMLRAGMQADVAVLVSTLPFAAGHLIGRQSKYERNQAITGLIAGTALGYVYVATRSFGAVVGAHLGWNIATGIVLIRSDETPGAETLRRFHGGFDLTTRNKRLEDAIDVVVMAAVIGAIRLLIA